MGKPAAFFDLDRTLMAGSSGFHWVRAARRAGMVTRRRLAADALTNVKFRLRGSTDEETEAVRDRLGVFLEGRRVAELERLGPQVLAGVLPRLYPRMLEVAYEHQDAGRPVYICTAATQDMAKVLAAVLGFDGAAGTRLEKQHGVYTGRLKGPMCYGEGKPIRMREIAERDGLDLSASWAYSDSESDLPMLRAVGHPVAVNPDAELGRIAGEEGWEVMRFERLGRRLKIATAVLAAIAAGGGAGFARSVRAPAAQPSGRLAAVKERRAIRVSLSELTDEQREIRALARRYADEVIAPQAPGWDRDHTFPKVVLKELGELGLMGVCVPAEHAGAGADFLSYVLVLEELSRADAGVGVTVAVHTSACTLPLLAHGDDDQIGRLVPPLAQGHELGAFALTEPGAGSDAAAIVARADADARVTATKQWITNGSHAHTFIVFARDEAAAGRPGAFVVRRGAAGFRAVREEDKLGLHSSSTADLVFDETPSERLGEPGTGMRIALAALDGGRIGIAAQAVGIAQAALDVAVAHARERSAFGRLLAAHETIQQKLADMQTAVAAARALTWRAARRKDAGLAHTAEGAQAKLFASRTAREVSGEAIQVLGGYGYTTDSPAERYYRDAKVTEIYEGTSEIQRLVIARALLGDDVTRP